MMPPRFWNKPVSVASIVLEPLSFVYGLAVMGRGLFSKAYTSHLPVICIGNYTLGGTGKTPTVIYAAAALTQAGHTPFVVTRGYGGKIKGPHQVVIGTDGSDDVGDEALLHARSTPTIIARSKIAGVKLAEQSGASVILLDDGMQNPSVTKTLTIAVIDAAIGFGNAKVFPSGPLRAPLFWQDKRIDAAVLIHTPDAPLHKTLARFRTYLHFTAQLAAARADWLNGARVLAFCGIGNPRKFHDTLTALSARVIKFKIYPDHYQYDGGDAKELIEEATRESLMLVTTEKDHVRLHGRAETRARLAGLANTVPIEFKPDDERGFKSLLLRAAPIQTEAPAALTAR